MDVYLQEWHVMDSMPIPVCAYARASRNLRFATDFQVDNSDLYGHCAAKKENIYGFKLHLMVTTQGIPTNYVLAPASHHDVKVAPELLESYPNKILSIFDKGYVGLEKKLSKPEDYQLMSQKNKIKSQIQKQKKLFWGFFVKLLKQQILFWRSNLTYNIQGLSLHGGLQTELLQKSLLLLLEFT